jgi:hypothetical protein
MHRSLHDAMRRPITSVHVDVVQFSCVHMFTYTPLKSRSGGHTRQPLYSTHGLCSWSKVPLCGAASNLCTTETRTACRPMHVKNTAMRSLGLGLGLYRCGTTPGPVRFRFGSVTVGGGSCLTKLLPGPGCHPPASAPRHADLRAWSDSSTRVIECNVDRCRFVHLACCVCGL